MLNNKFNRHTLAFLTTALASILLYPAVQAGSIAFTWIFLGLVLLAAFLTLLTK
jgi:ABC-type transport system involved in cytochrome bd biosynthesis fused ATPase/permease subunit